MVFPIQQWKDYLRECDDEKRTKQKAIKSSQLSKIGWNVVHQLSFEEKNIQRWKIYLETGIGIPVRQTMLGRYIGLVDRGGHITPAGKELLNHGMKDVWQQQIEKWYYCVDDFHRPPDHSYNIYPFFGLLKILLMVGDEDKSVMPRYSISLDEFRFLVVTIKDYSECAIKKEMILDFRKNYHTVINDLPRIFGQGIGDDNRTCSDRIIQVLERSDYLIFTSDRVILKKDKISNARKLIQKFECLMKEGRLPMYRKDKNQYFDMLYSKENIFQHCGLDIDFQFESLVDESISLIEKDEDFTDEKEKEYERKSDIIIPKNLSPEEREKRARKFLEKYKEKTPSSPPQITKAYIRKIERGPIGSAVKEKYNSICQVEGCKFTFKKKDGTNYAESHHLEGLGEGGKDIEENIVVLCANCHRMIHYAKVEKVSRDKEKLVVKINDELKTIKFKP